MSWKKVNKKEWIEKGLPESTTFISPFYEWDRKKKGFKKPVPMVSNINVNHLWEIRPKKRNNLFNIPRGWL